MASVGNHAVTARFTDLVTFATLAELPVNGVKFSLALCGSGPFSTSFRVEDPLINQTDWINATAPGKTACMIDIDGILVYAARIAASDYDLATQTVSLSGSDFWGYMAQRLQAADYTNFSTWTTSGAGAMEIAQQILTDAVGSTFSIPIQIVADGSTPAGNKITYSAPITQRQTVDSMVSQLHGLAHLYGFDFAQDLAFVGGLPQPTITLSYPRRGRSAIASGLTLDLSNILNLKYSVDSSGQSNAILEQSGANGSAAGETSWAGSFADGYPLLEQAISHTSVAPTANPGALLNAFAEGDLAAFAYPLTVPVVTVPLFGDLNLGSFVVGDDILLTSSPGANGAIPVCPRFPDGLQYYWRIVRVDVNIPDEGLPTMDLVLNVPPNTIPQAPPI